MNTLCSQAQARESAQTADMNAVRVVVGVGGGVGEA